MTKTERKWTPGPWQVGSKYTPLGVYSLEDRLVANTHSSSVNFGWEKYEAENDANAQLIAAAPRLYDALDAAYDFIADQYGDVESQALEGEFVSAEAREIWETICAALSEAHGEPK